MRALIILFAFSTGVATGACYVSGIADELAAEHIRTAHGTECATFDCWE